MQITITYPTGFAQVTPDCDRVRGYGQLVVAHRAGAAHDPLVCADLTSGSGQTVCVEADPGPNNNNYGQRR